MSLPPASLARYLDKQSARGPWQLEGDLRRDFRGAVVIPSLAEGDSLFATLESLSGNDPQWTRRFLVVVVFNHSDQADRPTRLQNEIDLARALDFAQRGGLCLAWVDAVSPGKDVPNRQAGVGFARKLGMDLALQTLDWSGDPVLVCLDADTLVDDKYLQAIDRHFQLSDRGGAVLPFRHQSGSDPARQAAIDCYELYLRSYVYGLRLAGSPYAFNAVGSAIACRASSYVRCGGMNHRKAGEDFYFLQKLAKTDGVALLSGTTVYPAPRVSERVPFGTGRSMARLLAGDDRGVLCYPAAVFRLLAAWLQLAEGHLAADSQQLLAGAAKLSPVLEDYLTELNWHQAWTGMHRTHQGPTQRKKAFHTWFDGFRTLRLIHKLCDTGYRRGQPEEVLPAYFAWEGRVAPGSRQGLLERLRADDMA